MTEPIPASIVQAICKVQAAMGAVKKDQRNQHGGYQFASTDAVYAELTHKLADAGLVIVCLEDEIPEIEQVERGDGKASLRCRFTFSFVMATKEATWVDKGSRRTVVMQVTGPQTFMAAQSYAEKSYLRSLFKLPTGDMDLDSVAEAETVEGQQALNGEQKRKSSRKAKADGTTQIFEDIRKAILNCQSRALLEQIPDLYAEEIATLPRNWNELIQDEYRYKLKDLTEAENA